MARHQVPDHRGRGRARLRSRQAQRPPRRPARRAAAGYRAGADLAVRRAPAAIENREPRLVHVLVRVADAADVPGLSDAAAASRLLADAAGLRSDYRAVLLAVCAAGAAVRDRVALARPPKAIECSSIWPIRRARASRLKSLLQWAAASASTSIPQALNPHPSRRGFPSVIALSRG